MYVAPTLALLNETRASLRSKGIKCDLITNETHQNQVTRAIVEYLNAAESTGKILLITHHAYLNIPFFFANRDNWEIFIDEVTQLDCLYTYLLPAYNKLLLEHIHFTPWKDTELLSIDADLGSLRILLQKADDDVRQVLQPLLSRLISPNHFVFVDQDTVDKLKGNKVHRRGEDEKEQDVFPLGPCTAGIRAHDDSRS